MAYLVHLPGSTVTYRVDGVTPEQLQAAVAAATSRLQQLPPFDPNAPVVPTDSSAGAHSMTGAERFQNQINSIFGDSLNSTMRAARPLGEKAADVAGSVAQGVSLGHYGDLLGVVGGAADAIGGGSFGQGFNDYRDWANNQQVQFQIEHPAIAAGAELGGSLLTAGGLARAGLSPTANARSSIGSMAPAAAAEGAAYGAIYGSGTGDTGGERVRNALAGAGTGALMGWAGGSLGGTLANRSAVAAAPTRQAIKDQANTLYTAARSIGLTLDDNSYTSMINRAGNIINANTVSHPQTNAIVSRLAALPRNPTLEEIDGVRSDLARIARTQNTSAPADRGLASQLLGMVDQYMDNLTPADVVAGDPKLAMNLIGQARSVYRQGVASDMIQEAVDSTSSARMSPQQQQMALANSFRNIETQVRNNPSTARLFTPDQIAAIHEIANGGNIENALRRIGYVGSSSLAHLGTGAAIYGAGRYGGPLAAAGTAIGGGALLGAGRTSAAITRQNANLLGASVRSASQASANPFIGRATQGAIATLPGNMVTSDPGQAILDTVMPPDDGRITVPLIPAMGGP